ncbi:MAG: recombination protein O N-terminal domain-containing protein [Candidatus Gracilibacteria bacterium]|nr:recombination protein O N-terminal domain-containing protein [Candidatus Gracilibacteria bacterium]
MSVFKSKGIILKYKFLNQKGEILYDIFSLDYGKIQAIKKSSKKEKILDLGNLIDFEIETSLGSNINKIRNIKIINTFYYLETNFNIINIYLEIINLISKNTPEGIIIKEIYDVLFIINTFKNIDYTKLVLSKLKIFSIFGNLNLENKDLIVSKILNFISKNNIEKIFLLTGIDEKILQNLEKIK